MAQDALLEIALAAIGIDERAVLGLRHGVDRQIPPAQILLQRDVGRRMHGKSLISTPALALGARERVLLVGLRMQEHREILADGLEAEPLHLLRGRADDDVVAVLHRQAEQLVAHGAADDIGFHPYRSSSGIASASRSAASIHSRIGGSASIASRYRRFGPSTS